MYPSNEQVQGELSELLRASGAEVHRVGVNEVDSSSPDPGRAIQQFRERLTNTVFRERSEPRITDTESQLTVLDLIDRTISVTVRRVPDKTGS